MRGGAPSGTVRLLAMVHWERDYDWDDWDRLTQIR